MPIFPGVINLGSPLFFLSDINVISRCSKNYERILSGCPCGSQMLIPFFNRSILDRVVSIFRMFFIQSDRMSSYIQRCFVECLAGCVLIHHVF